MLNISSSKPTYFSAADGYDVKHLYKSLCLNWLLHSALFHFIHFLHKLNLSLGSIKGKKVLTREKYLLSCFFFFFP